MKIGASSALLALLAASCAVEVFEVLDKSASAKLTSFWGVDYFHLVKEDGQWKVVQVLWQTLR